MDGTGLDLAKAGVGGPARRHARQFGTKAFPGASVGPADDLPLMPTIAIVAGVRIVIWPRDLFPPHVHALLADREALISILTGEVLQGSLPPAKQKAVQAWLDANRVRVAYVWGEIRLGRWEGGRLD
jgi:hypothetical protein